MRSDGSSMAKKKSWFNLVKRFFISDSHSKSEKKEKRRKWMFGRLRIKRFATIAAPSSPKDRTLSEAEEEQSKRALTVAIATAAAAEAAVTAAQVAAEVVRLTRTPQPSHGCERDKEEKSVIENKVHHAPQSAHQSERKILELAAIKIQTGFRGYLAKKALRALKGIVKLQAIIRGRNVRRQAINTLKCLQSIVSIQSQVCAERFGMAGTWEYDENKQGETRDKIIKMDSNSQRRWDDSILTKKEADALFVSKKEAAIKRERIKEYSFGHRKSAESEQNKGNGRWRYWLEQWMDTQVVKSKELEDLDSVGNCARKLSTEEYRGKGLRLKSVPRQYQVEGLDSPILVPRRSFHRKQSSLGEENSFSSSPVFPAYMAATESARAKARSISSPKLRPGNYDTCSESYSPCKNKLSLISPTTSEVPNYGRLGRPSAYQQRSPSLKGAPGPIKSSRAAAKDLSFNSECSFRNWERQSALG